MTLEDTPRTPLHLEAHELNGTIKISRTVFVSSGLCVKLHAVTLFNSAFLPVSRVREVAHLFVLVLHDTH